MTTTRAGRSSTACGPKMPETPVTPIQQPPVEDLLNALQIAQAWYDQTGMLPYGDIARLIRHALDQLGEPNLASIQAAATMLREAQAESQGFAVNQRYARDAAAAILKAQLTGAIPRTWEAS